MGHLNVLKGTYLSTQQVDKSLPLETGKAAVRGSILVVADAGSAFSTSRSMKRYGAMFTPGTTALSDAGAEAYVALMGDANWQAQQAGTVTNPVISGLSLKQPMELEIDTFDTDADYVIGGELTYGTVDGVDGVVIPLTANPDGKVIGKVTKLPFTRYSNDATAIPGRMTGANISVLTFATA